MTNVNPPFSADQVNSLRAYQTRSAFHPYTCSVSKHGSLSVGFESLYCTRCDYVQLWVHDWTSDWSWELKPKNGDEMSGPQTPIIHFIVKQKEKELWVQDYSGHRNLVATCPSDEKLEWLVNCMVVFHKVNVIKWEEENIVQSDNPKD